MKMNPADEGQETAERSKELMKLRFQNYNPRTEDLKKYREEREDADATLLQIMQSQEEQIQLARRRFADPALDLDNMVPRKGNWDMKRCLSSKLERLEHRTRRAIVEMVRRKQREEGNAVQIDNDVQSISSDDE